MNKRQRRHFRINQPYCLKRLPCGRYIVLNRDYKPLGLETQEWVRYVDFPAEALPGMTPRAAAALSDRGSDSVDDIYLYNDGYAPTRSAANMDAYLNRLALLEKLKVAPGPGSAV